MARFSLIIIALLAFAAFAAAQENGETDVVKFRELRDKQFKDKSYSPLTAVDFSKFERLDYFPVSGNYRVKATFTTTPDEKAFLMPTSTGTAHRYRKIGLLKFKLNGHDLLLAAYKRDYEATDTRAKNQKSDLFVPFKDLSNGTETYSGGRYLYVRPSASTDEIVMDFNLAYNPSCAYGDPSFSCPIPPRENFLQVAINAGEKIYVSHATKQE
jgi:uncharacterized protein